MIIFNIVVTTKPLFTDKDFTKIAIMTENELKQELLLTAMFEKLKKEGLLE